MDTSTEKQPLGKVLVIGGCGFLGSHIVEGLAAYDAQVSILDYRCGDELNRNPNIEYYDADITKIAELLPVFEKGQFDLVIHNVSPLFLVASNDDFERVNIGGTTNIVEAAQRTGVKGLVYTSTAIIIQNNFYMPIDNADESWPVFTGEAQEDDYARSKVSQEIRFCHFNTYTSRPLQKPLYWEQMGKMDSSLAPSVLQVYLANATQQSCQS